MPDHHGVFLVDVDGEIGEFPQKTGDAADMVEVAVGEENCRELKSLLREKVDDAIRFLPGVDDPCLAVFTQDRAIDLESSNLYRESFHEGKWWAILDSDQ